MPENILNKPEMSEKLLLEREKTKQAEIAAKLAESTNKIVKTKYKYLLIMVLLIVLGVVFATGFIFAPAYAAGAIGTLVVCALCGYMLYAI